jgi:hypothetical protein
MKICSDYNLFAMLCDALSTVEMMFQADLTGVHWSSGTLVTCQLVVLHFKLRHCRLMCHRIRVRRITNPDDRTQWIDESDESLNDADEFDVTRLNMAKPGERYRVCVFSRRIRSPY